MDLPLLQVGLKVSDSVVVRITGCPNGCARPYMAELGLVGDGPNSYQVLQMSYINPSFGLQEKGQLIQVMVNGYDILAIQFAIWSAGELP